MTVWVLAADASRARIFQATSSQGALEELTDLLHPESRLREQGLVSDSPGRERDPGGTGHTMGHEDDAAREEWDRFAREVSQALKTAREAGRVQRLHVLAAPAFLGLLRKHLDPGCRALVASEQDTNVTGMDAKDIRARLPEHL